MKLILSTGSKKHQIYVCSMRSTFCCKMGFETIPVFRLYVSILKTLLVTEEIFFVCLFNSGVPCSTSSEWFSWSDLCVFLALGFYVLKTKFSFIEPHRYQYWTLFVLFFLWAFLSILHLLSTTPRVQSDVFYVSAQPRSDPSPIPPLVFCRRFDIQILQPWVLWKCVEDNALLLGALLWLLLVVLTSSGSWSRRW